MNPTQPLLKAHALRLLSRELWLRLRSIAVAGVYVGHRIQAQISQASTVRTLLQFWTVSAVRPILRSMG